MKSVLHIIDTTGPGGAETVFLDLVKASRDKGYRPVALIRGPGWVKSQLDESGATYYVIDCKGSINLSYLKQLIKLIKIENIDLIQTHLLGSAIYASLAGIICNKPVFSTFHGFVDIDKKERFMLAKLLILRYGCKQIITVTNSLNREIRKLKVLRNSNIQTILNGIETDSYEKKISGTMREDLGVNNSYLIGSLGNIRKPKNYPLAIEVISQLHREGIKVHYVIAGQGNDNQAKPLLDLIQQSNLEGFVHILGFVSDVQKFLSSLDCFLMTSSSEGHPLALTQAMINGLPIVSTPSGVEEIIDNGVNSMVSADHTVSSLIECLKELYYDREKALSLGKQASNKAKKLYSSKAMIQQYMTLYGGT